MEEYNPAAQGAPTSPSQQPSSPPQQQQQQRGRGRRQYAAQQYDFNAPVSPPTLDQHLQYPTQGYQQSQHAGSAPQAQGQYGQPQTYQQPGYQYGQESQAPSPNMYQQGFQGQTGVSG